MEEVSVAAVEKPLLADEEEVVDTEEWQSKRPRTNRKMAARFVVYGLLLTIVGFTAWTVLKPSRQAKPLTDADLAEMLVGIWKHDDDYIQPKTGERIKAADLIQLWANKKYTRTRQVVNGNKTTDDGTWYVLDGRLYMTINQSTRANATIGRASSSKLISVTPSQFIEQDGQEHLTWNKE